MAKEEEPVKGSMNGMTIVPTTSDEFLRAWLEVMRPLHKLTPKEMDYAAVLLKKREEIANEVSDQGLIDKLLFDEDTKEAVRREANISPSHAKAILYSMKNKGVIVGRRIDSRFIPLWKRGEPFRWVFLFKNEDK